MTFQIGHSSSNDRYRERTAASPPIVLRAKRCECGKQTTAKQLKQYGKCVACEKLQRAGTSKPAGRWLACAEHMPTTGVHRTAGQQVEQAFKLGRYQHFDGKTWGAVALDAAGALALANTPTQFRPTYWLAPQGEFA